MRFLRSLRVQILLWTILPLMVILVAVSFGSINLHQSSMRDMVAERDAHLAVLAAERLNDLLQARAVALETIQKSIIQTNSVPQGLTGVEPSANWFDLGVGVYLADGTPVGDGSTFIQPNSPAIQAIHQDSQANPGRTVFRLAAEPEKPWFLMLAVTDSQTKASVIGAISQRGLNLPNIFELVNRSQRTEPYLIATNGRVIYHRDERELNRDYRVHAGVTAALRGEAGAAFEHLPSEDEHVVGYAPIATTGWGLLIEEPWADVIVPGLQYTLWMPILVLVAAIASLTAVQFGLWRVIRPLQILGREASRMAWGDFHTIEKPVGGIAEIRDLQSTLQEMAAQVHKYQDGMRDYIVVLTQTQEEERKRLARELHDVIVQSVIALGQRVKILQLDWQRVLEEKQGTGTVDIEERLNKISELVGSCLQDLRNIIRDLRPIYLEELGLVSALETLANKTETDSLEVEFNFEGSQRDLPSEVNLAIYRIAQAAVTNAVRHGNPGFIGIELKYQEDGILLSIEDNGSGFVPPERPSDLALQGHYGLMGMYERTTRLGGHLSIRSIPGAGTKIVAFLPYSQQPGKRNLDREDFAIQ
jgi:signal transduction histidine kinase